MAHPPGRFCRGRVRHFFLHPDPTGREPAPPPARVRGSQPVMQRADCSDFRSPPLAGHLFGDKRFFRSFQGCLSAHGSHRF